MTIARVATVVYWAYGTSIFKAVYGRYGDKSTYTKDYLQVRSALRDRLNEAFGHQVGDPAINVEWRWPGGSYLARWDNKDSRGDIRGQLYVRTSTGAGKGIVRPFAVGDPGNAGTVIEGVPDAPNDTAANAVLAGIEAGGSHPWIMAVLLEGERRIVHARAVLTDPPPGRESDGIDALPPKLRDAMRASIAAGQESDFIDLEVATRATNIVASIEEALTRGPNVLVAGPPGCGKTVALEDLRARYEDAVWFDPDDWSSWPMPAAKVFETAFSPAYAYENFVAGLSPAPGRGIRLEARPGPLLNLAQWCRGTQRAGLLILDEFNRGPTAAIFGDTLALLDGGKRSGPGVRGAPISRPFPDRQLRVPAEFAAGSTPEDAIVPRDLTLPANLVIVGAFNSSDRSIAPLDAALLRRFAMIRVSPDAGVLAEHLGIGDVDRSDNLYLASPSAEWTALEIRRLAVTLLERLNERIRLVLGRDHELGHALLWDVPADVDAPGTIGALAAAFEEKVVAALLRSFRDQHDALSAVLNIPEDASDDGTPRLGRWLRDDGRLGQIVGPRLEIVDMKAHPWKEQLEMLRAVVTE